MTIVSDILLAHVRNTSEPMLEEAKAAVVAAKEDLTEAKIEVKETEAMINEMYEMAGMSIRGPSLFNDIEELTEDDLEYSLWLRRNTKYERCEFPTYYSDMFVRHNIYPFPIRFSACLDVKELRQMAALARLKGEV